MTAARRPSPRAAWLAAWIAAAAVAVGWMLFTAHDDDGAGGAAPAAAEPAGAAAPTAPVPADASSGASDRRIEPAVATPGQEPDSGGEPSATLTGRVVRTAAGGVEGVAGVEVGLFAEPPPFVRIPVHARFDFARNARAPLVPLATAVTESDGLFEMESPLRRSFLAVLDPYFATTGIVAVDPAAADRAPPLVVTAAGVIRGRVLLPDGGGAAGARVALETEPDPSITFGGGVLLRGCELATADDGGFEFPSVPAGHRLQLRVLPKDHLALERQVEAPAGRAVEVVVELASGVSLAGRVTGPEGAPLAGASVIVRDTRLHFTNSSENGITTVEIDTETDAEGRFRVTGLPSGAVNVEARKAPYAAATLRALHLPEGGLELPTPIVLQRGATIHGRVVDDRGEPIAGARVVVQRPQAMLPATMNMTPDQAAAFGAEITKTADDGSFTSPALPPGRYDVGAEAAGHGNGGEKGVPTGPDPLEIRLTRRGAIRGVVLSQVNAEPLRRFRVAATRAFGGDALFDFESFRPQPVRDVVSPDGRFEIDDVQAGEVQVEVAAPAHAVKVVAGLEVLPGEVTEGVIVLLEAESVLAGRVVERGSGRAVPRAVLTVRSGLDRLRPDPLGHGGGTLADEDGRFRIDRLPRGRVTVTAFADEHAPAAFGPYDLTLGQRLEDLVYELAAGGVVEGVVTGADGAPRSGSVVSVQCVGEMVPHVGFTDDAGHYRVGGLAGGFYVVTSLGSFSLEKEDFTAGLLASASSRNVRVPEGQVVRVDFAAPAAVRGTTVTGVVTEGDVPLGGAILSFVPEEGSQDGRLSGMRLATADPEGRYEIEDLAPGAWGVTVQAGSSFADALRKSFDIFVPDVPRHVEDIAIAPSGIAGMIVSRKGRAPVSGARVTVDALHDDAVVDPFLRDTGSRRVAEVFADEQGRYRARGLPPGSYRVLAGGPGFFGIGETGFARSEPRVVAVARDFTTEGVDFELEPGGTVAGVVRGADGGPLSGASLFLVDEGGDSATPFGDTQSDTAGAFEVSGLRPGRYVLVAKAEDLAPFVAGGVRVHAEERTEVEPRLEPGGRLEVVVTSASGAPVAGARVTVTDASGLELTRYLGLAELMKSLGTAATPGTFDVGALAPGAYTVAAQSDGQRVVTAVTHGKGDQQVLLELP